MNTTEISVSRLGVTILRPILIGGSLAGTFDLVIALLIAGRDAPLEIAGGLLGKSTEQGGGRNMGSWYGPSLRHRTLCRSGLLPSRPKAGVPEPALVCVRPIFWNWGLPCDELDRSTAQCIAHDGAV